MRCPSATRLVEAFRITEKQADLIRQLCKLADDADKLKHFIDEFCPETSRYGKSCFHDPYTSHNWRVTMVLHAVDCLIGGSGIEPLGPVDMREGPPFEYINMGDTYAQTLIYKREKDALYLGCWGDVAERHPEWEKD